MSERERDVEPSEGTAMDLDLDGPSRQRTSTKRRRNEDKNETRTETDNRKRKSPVHATSPASRRSREERDQADDINKKLDWLVDEIMQIKRSIGKQDKEKDKEVQKKRTQPQLREKKSGVTERKRLESNAPPPKSGKALNKDGGTTWSQVVGKGASRNLGRTSGTAVASQRPPPTSKKTSTQQKKRRLPRTSAVVITCPPGQYEENLRVAKEKIILPECGIEGGLNFKRTLTGALAIELPGLESNIQADNLASNLRALFADKEGVKITRPMKMAELRVRDLDDSIRRT